MITTTQLFFDDVNATHKSAFMLLKIRRLSLVIFIFPVRIHLGVRCAVA